MRCDNHQACQGKAEHVIGSRYHGCTLWLCEACAHGFLRDFPGQVESEARVQ